MSDVAKRINDLQADLQNLEETADNLAIDIGGDADAPTRYAHRVGTLHVALKTIHENLADVRDELDV